MNVKSSTNITKEKKQKMMLRGFMCHSPAAMVVCMTNADARSSVIDPRSASSVQYMMRRSSSTWSTVDPTHARSLLNNKCDPSHYYYSRLLTSTTSTPQHEHAHPCTRRFNNKEGAPRDRTLNHQPMYSKSKMSPPIPKTPSSDPVLASSSDNFFQVVVMRVSLHCQGCASKVKKLLSKMEGVASFSIDLETKMVTVRGHVSPVGVLESISKVKKAELWPC